ncbi:MAG: glycosyltransferase family 2 protein [Oscillatoriales cyanobacterium SM2_2_1]|nr:glycosyltransferase family 2 protein [Oscillatoriales cyanobacterium SM2_2_1]
MDITLIVPTYRRPRDLARCLGAIARQTQRPDQLLLVVRDTDHETRDFLAAPTVADVSWQVVTVTEPGMIAAMNAGLDQATGAVVAFTDDDAAPHPDWLERIAKTYAQDPQIGGVGGRDYVYVGDRLLEGAELVVGQVQWFGRVVGNHHLGSGGPRDVDVLKGVNMSYRRAALGERHFDGRLLGSGAQPHNELAMCLRLRRAGWRLIYDPQIAVDHFPAHRPEGDERVQFNELTYGNAVHNETLALLDGLPPWRQMIFLLWALAIGTSSAFGLVQWLRFLPRDAPLATQKLRLAWQSRWQGWQTHLNSPAQP